MKVYLKNNNKKDSPIFLPQGYEKVQLPITEQVQEGQGTSTAMHGGPTAKLFFSPHLRHVHFTSVLSLLVWNPGPDVTLKQPEPCSGESLFLSGSLIQ